MGVSCCMCWGHPWEDCENAPDLFTCHETTTTTACYGQGGAPSPIGYYTCAPLGCWNCNARWPDGTPDNYGCCINGAWVRPPYHSNPLYYLRALKRLQATCANCNGELTLAEECGGIPEPEMPEGCVRERQAPRLPRGGLPWTLDLCSGALFGLDVQAVDANPGGEAMPLSAHPVRAMTVIGQQLQCMRHRGQIGLMPNGDCAAVYCNDPATGTIQTHWAPAYVEDESDGTFVRYSADTEMEERPIPVGDAGFAGTIHTPYWTELDYRSAQMLCGIYG